MPVLQAYSASPLKMELSILLNRLESLKKSPYYNKPINQVEKDSDDYLNGVHAMFIMLDTKLLPLFSQGKSPGVFDVFTLKRAKDMAKEIRDRTKPIIDTKLSYELTLLLQTFIHRISSIPFNEMASFLDVSVIPTAAKSYMIKLLGIDLFGPEIAFQTQMAVKKERLNARIMDYEQRVLAPPAKQVSDENAPAPAGNASLFFKSKPVKRSSSDTLETGIEMTQMNTTPQDCANRNAPV